jgi:hypothetical protein
MRSFCALFPHPTLYCKLFARQVKKVERQNHIYIHFKNTESLTSHTLSRSSSRKYADNGTSDARFNGSKRNGSSASINTTQGDIVVAKDLLVNGPSGTYSHACTSLAAAKEKSAHRPKLPIPTETKPNKTKKIKNRR